MKVTRRKLLAGAGLAAGGFGLATVVGSSRSRRADVDYSGMTTSEKPLVKNAHLSTDSESKFPNHYKALVTSRDELRWDYLVEEDAMLADSLEQTDWDSEVVAIFGMVLPRDRGFDPENTTVHEGTLTMNLVLERRPSESSTSTIMNQITRVENVPEPPEQLEVRVTY